MDDLDEKYLIEKATISVRFGYFCRKRIESSSDEDYIKCYIPQPDDLLVSLSYVVLQGISWSNLQTAATSLLTFSYETRIIPSDVEKILIDTEALREFQYYINDFQSGLFHLDRKVYRKMRELMIVNLHSDYLMSKFDNLKAPIGMKDFKDSFVSADRKTSYFMKKL